MTYYSRTHSVCEDVSETYLTLVQEHIDPLVLKVYFPSGEPRIALFEKVIMGSIDYEPFYPRRKITDLEGCR